MKKRIASLLIVFSLLASLLPAAFAVSSRTPYEAANALYTLGLFQGTGVNGDGTPVFALADTPTRAEAVTMLVRLLGRETDARAGAWKTPFTDIPEWAAPYIGYAYENGLARGESNTYFGSENAVSVNDFLTFALRALDYNDNAGDFTWATASAFADSIGLTSGEYINTTAFSRGDIAKIACAALSCTPKGESGTLLQTLLDRGAVSADSIQAAGLSSALTAVPQNPPDETGSLTKNSNTDLSAAQIYAACSPAVFYIEVFDAAQNLLGSGSGFFISSDGKAVTNYHVVEDASYAQITLADGETTYKVTGIYDYDVAQDVALIQIDGQNFPYLTPGDTTTVVGGAQVYAIGSPRGLSNSISEGIISNVSRTIEGTNYIQITAAISPGSSGGALLNSKGQVIGITAAGLEDSQNLNFAVPYTSASSLSSASLATLAQALRGANGAGAFAPSTKAVSLRVGESKSITVTQSYASASIARCAIENPRIVRARWVDWSASGSSIPLMITGLTPGESDIELILYNGSNAVLAQATIHVTVTG